MEEYEMGLENFLAFRLEEIPFVIVTLVIAFTLHEFAHAYVAYKFGDPTAKNQGRLTLSPFAHIDPIGALFILIAGFGWARPVPVNRFFFKNPRLAGVLVSLAGPVSNLLLAMIGSIIYFGFDDVVFGSDLASTFLETFISLNVLLFVFNLIPLPPLDGYRIVEDLVPVNVRAKMTQYEPYGVFIFLFLVITPLDNYTIHPILLNGTNAVNHFLITLFSPLIG
jgi:Zn-dependent protease